MAAPQDEQSSEVVSQPADISPSTKPILGTSLVGGAIWVAAWILSRVGQESLWVPFMLLLLAIPLCWLVILYACVRAVLDLVRRPGLRSVRNIAVLVLGLSLLLLVALNLLLSPPSGVL